MSGDFRIEISDWQGTHVVRLVGELDLASASTVARTLVSVAGSTVVVDMSDLSFIDSSGVAALAQASRLIEAQGDRIELQGARGIVRRMFGLLGMDEWLTG